MGRPVHEHVCCVFFLHSAHAKAAAVAALPHLVAYRALLRCAAVLASKRAAHGALHDLYTSVGARES